MTIKSSGQLSLTDIKNEFGGNAPTGLADYYAGGQFVRAGTSGVNGTIPSGGQLSMSAFYGASNVGQVTVSGNNASAYASGTGPLSETVTASNGGCTPANGSGSYSYAWSYVSGTSGIAISSATAQNPSWSEAMSVARGVDRVISAVWSVTVTDTVTGHTATATITVTLELESIN